jgi:hypothetical protein
MQMEGVYHKLWNKQLKHHEKIKREAENKQRLATTAATTVVSMTTTASTSNIVNRFKKEEEEDVESSISITGPGLSPNKSRNGSTSFAEEEGADGDDERQTTTAHESSDDEGEEIDEKIDEAH